MWRQIWLISSLGLLLLAASGYCEEQAEADAISAEQVYEQAHILWLARYVQLTAEQISQLAPLVQAVNDKQQQLLSGADTLWQQQDRLQEVLGSWIAGQRPPAGSLSTSQQVAATWRGQRGELEMLIAGTIARSLAALRPDQRALVESREQHEQRRWLRQQLEGSESPAEYIAQQLGAERELTPDEYQLVRVPAAQQLAAKIADPRTPAFGQLQQAILQLSDTVYAWPPEYYSAQAATLALQVAQFLNLPPTAAPPISYDELVASVSSPLAADSLEQIAAATRQASQEGRPPARKLADHPLQVIFDRADIVALFNDLQVLPPQLAQVLSLAERAQQVAQTAHNTVQSKIEQLQPTLQQARQLLTTSATVPPEVASAVGEIQETQQQARQQQRRAIAPILLQARSLLAPAQNALIDWQPPADVTVIDARWRMARLRLLVAEMRHAGQFLERFRYCDHFVYLQTRAMEAEAYLSNYVDPQSPAFPEGHDFVMGVLDRMKMTQEADWPAAAPELAAELVMGVGAFPALGYPEPTGRPFNWERLYEVFSSPHTAEVLQQMLQARSQPFAAPQ